MSSQTLDLHLSINAQHIKQTLNLWARRYETRQQLKSLSIAQLNDLGITDQQRLDESKRFFWQ